jgi:hypothetical protein
LVFDGGSLPASLIGRSNSFDFLFSPTNTRAMRDEDLAAARTPFVLVGRIKKTKNKKISNE